MPIVMQKLPYERHTNDVWHNEEKIGLDPMLPSCLQTRSKDVQQKIWQVLYPKTFQLYVCEQPHVQRQRRQPLSKRACHTTQTNLIWMHFCCQCGKLYNNIVGERVNSAFLSVVKTQHSSFLRSPKNFLVFNFRRK